MATVPYFLRLALLPCHSSATLLTGLFSLTQYSYASDSQRLYFPPVCASDHRVSASFPSMGSPYLPGSQFHPWTSLPPGNVPSIWFVLFSNLKWTNDSPKFVCSEVKGSPGGGPFTLHPWGCVLPFFLYSPTLNPVY